MTPPAGAHDRQDRHDRQDSVLDLLNRLLSVPSEQTALMEREPAVTNFIAEVVASEVRAAGLVPRLDDMGNLTAQVGTGQAPRRFLLTYAMTHAAAGMPDAYTPELRDGTEYGITGPVVRGRGACEQKGALAGTPTTTSSPCRRSPRPARCWPAGPADRPAAEPHQER